jgi:glycosyltransferase involved in cell wall biosynthesis
MQRNGAAPAGALPRVSVVIPAYRAAQTLPAGLAALAAQTYPADRLEIIVVDDGSPDATAAVAEAGGARVLRQANRGPATARNRGALAASGDLVLFTDADCVPTPTWVERMAAPFADPAVMGVKGAYRTRQRSLAARFAQCEFEDRYARQLRGPTIDMVDSYAAGFRRDFFLAAGGYDERFWHATTEDVEISYRMAEAGARLVFAPDALVYHTHPATLRRYLRVKFARGYWKLVVYRTYRGKAVRDSYTPQVMKLQSPLVAALLALAGPAALWRPARRLWALTGLALLGSALPFAVFAARRDPLVGVCAPLIVPLRALVIGLGTVAAMAGLGRGLDESRDPRGSLRAATPPAPAAVEAR